jgi:ribonuclease R
MIPSRERIIERLGRSTRAAGRTAGIFLKYDLAETFPPEVVREAGALPDRVHARELAGRLDYRQEAVFTIDPDDAKDFDDALSYEELPGGDIRVGIHIADVSTYVRAGTALDQEAQRRGNSTYLVGSGDPDAAGETLQRALLARRGPGSVVQGRVSSPSA